MAIDNFKWIEKQLFCNNYPVAHLIQYTDGSWDGFTETGCDYVYVPYGYPEQSLDIEFAKQKIIEAVEYELNQIILAAKDPAHQRQEDCIEFLNKIGIKY